MQNFPGEIENPQNTFDFPNKTPDKTEDTTQQQPPIPPQKTPIADEYPHLPKSPQKPPPPPTVTQTQNIQLKIQNKQLRKKLSLFQQKLDDDLKTKGKSSKKPRIVTDIVQSQQLKSMYLQCEHFKKLIASYKHKLAFIDQNQVKSLINQIQVVGEQRDKLKEQIKVLKRMNKQKQKGLVELTHPNYLVMMIQLEELKQCNKKLNEKHVKQERQAKFNKITVKNEQRRIKQAQTKQHQLLKKLQQMKQIQLQLLKSKIDKDTKTISYLLTQNKQIKLINQNLTKQSLQKDKQIYQLKQHLLTLKKQTKYQKRRFYSEITASSDIGNGGGGRLHQSQSRYKEIYSGRDNGNNSSFDRGKKYGKYPRLVQAGSKKQGSFKWNHHQFSSKIKQIKVSYHPGGHLHEINFRYQKGQPYSQTKGQFTRFCCQQNTTEYIRQIKGGYKNEVIQYLTVQTSKGRVQHFGKNESEQNCITFLFTSKQKQYLGAFFGQSSIDGINRIGCLIEREK